jgi:hypothetical protein
MCIIEINFEFFFLSLFVHTHTRTTTKDIFILYAWYKHILSLHSLGTQKEKKKCNTKIIISVCFLYLISNRYSKNTYLHVWFLTFCWKLDLIICKLISCGVEYIRVKKTPTTRKKNAKSKSFFSSSHSIHSPHAQKTKKK